MTIKNSNGWTVRRTPTGANEWTFGDDRGSDFQEPFCGAKYRFSTLGEAESAAMRYSQRSGHTAKAYRCRECRQYHFDRETAGIETDSGDKNTKEEVKK